MAGRAGLLLVVVTAAVTVVAPASSPGRISIANPDFPCGEPYGPNGEPPKRRRVVRQIVFPHNHNYRHYMEMLWHGEGIDNLARQGETPNDDIDMKRSFCSANVVSDNLILTAAHCVAKVTDKIRMVTLGDIDLTTEGEENSRAATYQIAGVIVHPDFSLLKPTRYNDVALLRTKEKIQFNDAVFPYCISDEIPAPGTVVIISGFGVYNATTVPQHQLEANFTVMDTAECEEIYKREDYEPILRLRYPNLLQGSDIICAIDDVSDACQGDSGGPVLREKDGKLFLEGIVSAGASCRANFKSILPGLYLSLAKHIDFIDQHVYGPPPAVP